MSLEGPCMQGLQEPCTACPHPPSVLQTVPSISQPASLPAGNTSNDKNLSLITISSTGERASERERRFHSCHTERKRI